MNSCLYECDVMHARFEPRAHRFSYRIFMFALDLDEVPALARRLPFFSLGRPNLYSFREGDYLPLHEAGHNPSGPAVQPASSAGLRARVEALAAALRAQSTTTAPTAPAGETQVALLRAADLAGLS